MSASEEDVMNATENDETLRLLNQVRFDIRDEAASVIENEDLADSSGNQEYEAWMEDVRDVSDNLEDILRIESRTSMVREAEELIKDKVVEPYQNRLAGNGPYVPGYDIKDAFLRDEQEAIISSGELEATYLDDIANLYKAIQSVATDENLSAQSFTDYKNMA